jgi:iron complex outermembrane receptor protein
MNNVSAKFSADLTDTIKATYMLGYWNNDTSSKVQTYLTDAGGNPTFGNISGFGTNTYDLNEQHLMNALSVKSDTKGDWDWEAVATRYDYLQDIQRASAGVNSGTSLKTNGTIARLDGTGWWTGDLKGIWRPTGINGEHEASFGAHEDQYTLKNPTFNTPNWMTSPDNGNGTYSTYGKGNTETDALWAQDAWKFAPALKLTLGARAEQWQAYDGYNLASNGVSTRQPKESSANISPKASLAWQADPIWTSTLSYGEAFRYPTVSELYQIVSSGPTFVSPNANLLPEHVYSWELAVQRQDGDDNLRVSLFQENTNNALISQTSTINGTITTSFQNVNEIRNRGIEVVAGRKNALFKGLDLSNSVTYVDSKILSDPNFASSTGTTATGKHVPYVPDWRDTIQATYHQDENLSYSASARYQGQMFSTLDNTDSVSSVYGSFDKFFVVDTHVHYDINSALSADAGIDNLFDEKYFLFHPFPQRTFVASVRMKF